MLTKDPPYPGRILKDEERLPFGLGWEYARRGLELEDCPFNDSRSIKFTEGFEQFRCSDRKTNKAMLTSGVPITDPKELKEVVNA